MVNTDDKAKEFYSRCVELSIANTKESVDELIELYKTSTDNQSKKDARKALYKMHCRKIVIGAIHSRIDSETDLATKVDLLRLGMLIYKERFIYEYLKNCRELHEHIPSSIIREISDFYGMGDPEYCEIARYMNDNADYNYNLFKILPKHIKLKLANDIMESILNNGEVTRGLSLIHI